MMRRHSEKREQIEVEEAWVDFDRIDANQDGLGTMDEVWADLNQTGIQWGNGKIFLMKVAVLFAALCGKWTWMAMGWSSRAWREQ